MNNHLESMFWNISLRTHVPKRPSPSSDPFLSFINVLSGVRVEIPSDSPLEQFPVCTLSHANFQTISTESEHDDILDIILCIFFDIAILQIVYLSS